MLLHCSRWILDPTRSWCLQTLKGVEMKLPRWGSAYPGLAALERILETLYQILFCFVHRPLRETAAIASKGSLSHHSPPMSCQEPVMAQVHLQHPSPPLGQSPTFPTCVQPSRGHLQAKAQSGQATNNLHTLVPYLVIATFQMLAYTYHFHISQNNIRK